MSGPADFRETPSLIVKVLRQFSTLMQDELALARAEMAQNARRAGSGLALIGIGAILALVALNILAGALVVWVAANGVSAQLAALIVGGGILVVALIFALIGKGRISAEALEPTRTRRSVQRDLEKAKETTHA